MSYNYRTDLAVESQDLLERARARATGFIKKESQIDEDIKVIAIEIVTEDGARAFDRPVGNYVTLEVAGILEQRDGIKERAARALADQLRAFIQFDYTLKVLVVGLGNEKVTPDSLGPHTVDKVKVTRHLFELLGCDGDWQMASVSGFNPSVTGVTGMETADLIEKAVSLTTPDVVVVIDALAAKDIGRLSTTIQICDTGIAPGAGMGNRRKFIDEQTLGCKVVAIGVPTVIDSRTLILEAAEQIEGWGGVSQRDEADVSPVERYLDSRDLDMIVTSTDIDQIIKDFSDILASAINMTLHPGIYS